MSVSAALEGIGASPGVAVGTALVLDRRKVRFPKVRLHPKEVGPEGERLQTALALAKQQLASLRDQLAGEAQNILVLEAHQLMLEDPLFVDEIQKRISQDSINAEWAVRRVAKHLRHQFDGLKDEYFRERRADVEFVADRVVRNLLGESIDERVEVPPGSVVVAHDLAPAEAALLVQTGKVIALVTDLGGQTSHTAIVARAREIPAVVGVGRATEAIRTGDRVAVNGALGTVAVSPTEHQLELYYQALQHQKDEEVSALQTASLSATTTDGHAVSLWGNMEFPEEIPSLLTHGAEGIGLYRTEFLFMNRSSPPGEEEHFQAYREVLLAMEGRPVTIRTVDLGGDKVPGKKHEREVNPAMGLRAIRYCLADRLLFRNQLRALLRAAVFGDLRVMFPLVSGLSELREARSELELCRSELSRAGVPMGKRFPVGIMVETPSAAWMADRLAQEADFFSVGTNDLIQYTLAIDRHNQEVAYLYQPLHLGILRSIEHIASAAKAADIPVSMCGEMAGDPALSAILVALGLDSLSMTAGQIPSVKRSIRAWSFGDAKQLLARAMAFSSPEEIERYVRSETQQRNSAAHLS